MNLSTHLGKSDNPIAMSVFFPSDSSVNRSLPPFQPGDLVRPRCPAHPWRQYPIVVETCALIGQVWLLTVSIQTPTAHPINVLAEDYEPANRFHRSSTHPSQRADCENAA